MVLGVHGQDFLGGVLSTASQGQLDGRLLATNGDGRRVEVAAYTARGTPDLRREATFPVANRQWTLVTGADSAYLPGARSSLPITVLLGGDRGHPDARLAGVHPGHRPGPGPARSRSPPPSCGPPRRRAAARPACSARSWPASATASAWSTRTARSCCTIPAAKALLGVSDDVDGPQGWQQHYGLFRPDGRTPFPVDEMPLVRALRGESSDGVEMLVRNAGRPDGILVSVDGRPLDPSAGQPGAVAVFHDITELRQYETDLSVFAGVVAHDLKAPLAVIRGHCESAADELAEAPDSPEVDGARAALARIARAVDRMAGLIDTLLAYTTSKDAPLRRQTVALGPLVADVIQGRTAHLRPGDAAGAGHLRRPAAGGGRRPGDAAARAGQPDRQRPQVRPGRPRARIDITAADGRAGWTRIEIADRGIGIPDDDKPDIFESFHRARTAAGYAGTGLGLAICRRIVERHGGAIGVADNPGGGTRFHFTLPLAARPARDRAAPRGCEDRAALGGPRRTRRGRAYARGRPADRGARAGAAAV